MSVRVLRLDDPLVQPEEVVPVGGLREVGDREAAFDDAAAQADRQLSLYRDRTVALLRRYLHLSLEAGRLPSLLGREFFRARISAYQTATFEDTVIFVHDVERSLEELDHPDQTLIAMIVLQEHSQEETAHLLGYTRRTVVRRYAEALDRVSKIFLRKQIMERFAGSDAAPVNGCQEGKSGDFLASDSRQAKYNF